MDYLQTSVTVTPFNSDAAEVLMALMGDIGYESFEEKENGFEAYIPAQSLNEAKLAALSLPFEDITFSYTHTKLPAKNWNEEWEKNYFQPIVVGKQVVIRSPFHTNYPTMPIEIVIAPKMSFGTGHHETTAMMIEHILEMDIKGKRVLDMGCGTGILGILASIKGAAQVVGVDIDEWCVENSLENCTTNSVHNMAILHGTVSTIKQLDPFDVILANINRNILLEDMQHYVNQLSKDGTLVMSGFYQTDLEIIAQHASKLSLIEKSQKENNQWVAVAYKKK